MRLFFSSYQIQICDKFLFIKRDLQKIQKSKNFQILRKIKNKGNVAIKQNNSSEKLINDENEGVEEIKKFLRNPSNESSDYGGSKYDKIKYQKNLSECNQPNILNNYQNNLNLNKNTSKSK